MEAKEHVVRYKAMDIQLILLCMFAAIAEAQIPSACTAVTNKQCCPNDCSGHGTCTDITSYASWGSITGPGQTIVEKVNMSTETYGRQDVRFQWPTVLFTHVCKCDASYGGPDCSDCDFGYEMTGGQCQRITRVRKSLSILSKAEISDFIKVLNESKNEDPSMYQWAVVVQEPDKDGMNVQYVKTATYDFFVYHHFITYREGDVFTLDGNIVCPNLCNVDFAHVGPAFLTWHRYYLLLLERELGRIAERLKSDNRITSNWNRYNFGLPYWDWGDADEDFSKIFSAESFGRFEKSADRAVVTGNLFDGNNWPVVCDQHYRFNLDHITPNITCNQIRKICNPITDRTQTNQLERGGFTLRGRGSQDIDDRLLPIQSTIKHLFNSNLYDYPCENSTTYSVGASGNSFRNRVEGFVNIVDSADSKFETCGSGSHNSNFHNLVHVYINGHMGIVPTAGNDPIFYMHHNNIDRIFEKWLRKYKDSQFMPTARTAHPGHNADDYLVPFFPLKTNRDMLKEGTEFGFKYDMLPAADPDAPDPGTSVSQAP